MPSIDDRSLGEIIRDDLQDPTLEPIKDPPTVIETQPENPENTTELNAFTYQTNTGNTVTIRREQQVANNEGEVVGIVDRIMFHEQSDVSQIQVCIDFDDVGERFLTVGELSYRIGVGEVLLR